MDIKDLELKKEMTAEERSAVEGGAVFSLVGSFQNANATGIGNTAANVGPTVTNVDASQDIDVTQKLNQIIGSVNAVAGQF
ncbi:MAG: hypothetical protein OEY03_02825 [Rhizobacter sp.]|nr:hypothetical protein [Rhizobacter sp.]